MPPGYISEGVYVLYYVFAYCHFEQAKYYANCTRPKKKKKQK